MEIKVFAHKDRDDLIAELWHGDLCWGQITLDHHTGKYTLDVFVSSDGNTVSFDLKDVQIALEQAEHRLLELQVEDLFSE